MYNRARFNHTPYNRSTVLEFQWKASVDGVAAVKAEINICFSFNIDPASGISDGSGLFIRIIFPDSISEALSETLAAYVRVFMYEGIAEAISGSSGTKVSLYELATMLIQNINMAAGDTLIIDTDHMTVTLNGVNVVDKISDESEFFDLKPGLNEIAVSSKTAASKADVKILWKDKWL